MAGPQYMLDDEWTDSVSKTGARQVLPSWKDQAHHGNRGSQPFQSMARFVGDHLLPGPLQPPSRDSASQCSLWMPHSIFQSPHAGHSSHIGLSQPMPPLGASLHSFCQVNPSRPPGLSLDVTSSRKSSKTA